MIQRIQSVYLISTVVLICLLFFNPFIFYITKLGDVEFSMYGFLENHTMIYNIPMIILVCIAGLISFISIFLYKNRILQMRLCVFNIFLLVGIYALGLFYILTQINFEIDHISKYGIGLIFPAIAAIFTYLALRAIAKDEALIKSVDRIR